MDLKWHETYNKLINEKRLNRENLLFWVDSDLGLLNLEKSVLSGSYPWAAPTLLRINKKTNVIKVAKKNQECATNEREVYLYPDRDRLVQHVVLNYISSTYSEYIHKNCWSYKSNISVSKTVHSIFSELNSPIKYFYKIDIKDYFNSVSFDLIEQQINSIFSNNSNMRTLLLQFFADTRVRVHNDVIPHNNIDQYETHRNDSNTDVTNKHDIYNFELIHKKKGLVAGSSFSGFFANTLLYNIDEWGTSSCPVYARYCDDILIGHSSLSNLTTLKNTLITKLLEFNLEVNPSKIKFMELSETSSIDFLGLSVKRISTGYEFDLSTDNFVKVKKMIKSLMKYEKSKRKVSSEIKIKNFFKKFNKAFYNRFLFHRNKFGWAVYIYASVNTIKTLREIDFYLCNMARYLGTGKHNKSSIGKFPTEYLKSLGYKSVVDYRNFYLADKHLYRDLVCS